MHSIKGFNELLLGGTSHATGEPVGTISMAQVIGIIRTLSSKIDKVSPVEIAKAVAKLIPDEIVVPATDTEKMDLMVGAYAKRYGAGSGYIAPGQHLEEANLYEYISDGFYTGGKEQPLRSLRQGFYNTTNTGMPEVIVDGSIFTISGVGDSLTNIYPSPPEPQLYADGYESDIVHPEVITITSLTEFDGALFCTSTEASVGRVYKSDNDGQTWQRVYAAANNSSAITGIATYQNKLYICTSNPGSGCDVYSSVDGLDWSDSHQNFTGIDSLHDIKVVRNNLYVGTIGGSSALWKSTDGLTFTVNQLAGDASSDLLEHRSNLFFIAKHPGGNTIYASTNDGATWRTVSTVEIDSPVQKIGSIGSHLIIFTTQGIWRSQTGEEGSWEKVVSIPQSTIGIAKDIAYSSNGDIYVAYSPSTESANKAGMSGIFGSPDGKEWHCCWNEDRSPSKMFICEDTLFTFGTDSFVSKRNVRNLKKNEFFAKKNELFIAKKDIPIGALSPGVWEESNLSIGDKQVSCMTQGPDGTLYAGTKPNGLILNSVDNGTTWAIAYTTSADEITCFGIGPDDFMYAGDSDGKIHYFDEVWTEAYNTGTDAVTLFLNDANFIYAFCDGGKVFRSDVTLAWEEIFEHNYDSIICGVEADGFLYVGAHNDSSSGADILRSGTGGASWGIVSTGATATTVHSIVKFKDHIYSVDSSGVVKRALVSDPNTWEDLIPSIGLTIKKMVASTLGDKLYALNSDGTCVYETPDGDTWTDVSLGKYFTGTGVTAVNIAHFNGLLFIGTKGLDPEYGGRVYRVSPTFDLFELREAPVLSCYWFDEIFWEDVEEKDFVYPGGIIQNTVGSFAGKATVPGSFNGADTYSLFSDVWQDPGTIIGMGFVWSTMTAEDKNAFVTNPTNNMHRSTNGTWTQSRLRKRGVVANSGTWMQGSDPTVGPFQHSINNYVKPKGTLVSISSDLADNTDGITGYFDVHDNGLWKAVSISFSIDDNLAYEGKCFAIPGVLQQLKRNKGAFHRQVNPCGTAWCTNKDAPTVAKYYYEPSHSCVDLEDCIRYRATDASSDGTLGGTMVREDGLSYEQVDVGDFKDYTLSFGKVNLALFASQLLKKNRTNKSRGVRGEWRYKRSGVQKISSIMPKTIGGGVTCSALYFEDNSKKVPPGYETPTANGREYKIILRGNNKAIECISLASEEAEAHYVHPKHGDVAAELTLGEWYEWMVFERSSEMFGSVNYNHEVINGSLKNLAAAGLVGVTYTQSHSTATGTTIATEENPYLASEYERGEIDAIYELDANDEWILHTDLWHESNLYLTAKEWSRVNGNPIQVIYNERSSKYTRFVGLPLVVGESGENLFPDGTEKTWKLSEKCVGLRKRLVHSFPSGAVADMGMADAATINGPANGITNNYDSLDMQYITYAAMQSYLEPSILPKMEEEMFSPVYIANTHFADKGCIFINLLLNKVSTTNSGPHETQVLLGGYSTSDDLLNVDDAHAPTHSTRSLEKIISDGPAVKVFGYPTRIDGRLAICWIWNELVHDFSRDMDNIIVITADLAHPAVGRGVPLKLTGFDNPIVNNKVFVASEAIPSGMKHSGYFNAYFIDTLGVVRQPAGMESVYRLWDGDGWGDDGTFKVKDGVAFALDSNGNVIECGCAVQLTNKQM